MRTCIYMLCSGAHIRDNIHDLIRDTIHDLQNGGRHVSSMHRVHRCDDVTAHRIADGECNLQSNLVEGGLVALGYLTISALLVAAAIGSVYFARIEEAREMQREVDLLQRQLGESLLIVLALMAGILG